jgi:hypothetical protein
MADARREGRLKPRKLNGEKAVAICAAFDAGVSIPTLAERYNVTVQAIWQAATGKTYKAATARDITYVPGPTGRPRKAQQLAQAA